MDELNSLMERVETTDTDVIKAKGIMKKPGAPRSFKVRDGDLSSEEGEGHLEDEEEENSMIENDLNGSKDEGIIGESAYECIKCANFVGDMTSIKDHVIKVHLKHRLYLCDFCDAARNDLATMVEHMQKMHPERPQRFTHAYGKFKEEVDAMMKPVGNNEGSRSEKRDETYLTSMKCPLCSDVCKNQADFDWHLAEEHPQYVKYKCGYCQVCEIQVWLL